MRKLQMMMVLALLFIGGALWAQIAVGLHLNRENFILYEPVFAKVILRNDSGHTLVFGESEELRGRLNFEIIDPSGQMLQMVDSPENPLQGMILQAGQTVSFIVPLQDYFKFPKVGNYRIHAWVTHRQLKSDYKSRDLTFEVQPGFSLWERSVGVPDLNAPISGDRAIPQRTYELRMLQAGNERLLFLMIMDDDTIYALRPLGKALGEEKVLCDVDRFGRLHLLVPLSPKVFQYLLITPQGENIEERVYRTTVTVPILVRDPDSGHISVAGGAEATLGIDYGDQQVKDAPPAPARPEL